MIKEILLFGTLLQIFNALETTEETTPKNENNSSNVKFEKCSEEDGHVLLSKGRLCIPGGKLKWKIQRPPRGIIRNKIEVKISHAQVIEIDVLTLTITVSMDLAISWDDFRLQLGTEKAMEVVYLNADEEKEIWSPQIVVGSNMVSQNRHIQHYSRLAIKRACISVPIFPSKLRQQVNRPLAGPTSF